MMRIVQEPIITLTNDNALVRTITLTNSRISTLIKSHHQNLNTQINQILYISTQLNSIWIKSSFNLITSFIIELENILRLKFSPGFLVGGEVEQARRGVK